MGTVINTNVQALNSQRSLKVVSEKTGKASEKLSSGLRINRAGDDAAGLAISEKMRNQIKGLNQASRNSQDGISLIQTAEGALQETHDMLQRMRELVIQASNDTNEVSDREKIALEIDELSNEIDSTAVKTEFNKKKLIDGSWAKKDIYLQVGANEFQSIEFGIDAMNAVALGVTIGDIGNIVRTGSYAPVSTLPPVDTTKKPTTTVNLEGTYALLPNSSASTAGPLGKTQGSEASQAAALGGGALKGTISGGGGVITFGENGTISVGGTTVKTMDGSAVTDGAASALAGKVLQMDDGNFVFFTKNSYHVASGSAVASMASGLDTSMTGLATSSGTPVTIAASGATDTSFGANITVSYASAGTATVTIASGVTYLNANGSAVDATEIESLMATAATATMELFGSDGSVLELTKGSAAATEINFKTGTIGTDFKVITGDAKASGDLLDKPGALTYSTSGTGAATVTFGKNSYGDDLKLFTTTGSAVTATALANILEGTATAITLLTNDGNLLQIKGGTDGVFVSKPTKITIDDAVNTVPDKLEIGSINTVANSKGTATTVGAGTKIAFDKDGKVSINGATAIDASLLNGKKIAVDAGSGKVQIIEFDSTGYTVSSAIDSPAASGVTYAFDAQSNTKAKDIFGSSIAKNVEYSSNGSSITLKFTEDFKLYDATTGDEIDETALAGIMQGIKDGDVHKFITNNNQYVEIVGELNSSTGEGTGRIEVRDYTSGTTPVTTATKTSSAVDATLVSGTYVGEVGPDGEAAGLTVNADGTIKITGQLKDTDGNVISSKLTKLEDLKGLSVLTDKGTLKIDAEGKNITLDPNVSTVSKAAEAAAAAEKAAAEKAAAEKAAADAALAAEGKGLNQVAADADAKAKAQAASATTPGKIISSLVIKIDAAIEIVSTQRAQLGAYQNRMEHTIKNLDTSSENLSASESRIRDTDMAKEMMEFTKSNVLSQAAQSMLAQANQAPNNVLSLLR